MTDLKLITFGGVRVLHNERDITAELPTKIIALLIYVARHGKPKPREHLAELFWGDKSAKQAYGSLRTAISKAKPLLGEALQVTHSEIGVSAWLDANQFDGLVANPLRREDGLKLYLGDFMASFFADDAREFEDWQLREAEKLHEQFIQITQLHIQDLQKSNQIAEAILSARRALALSPLREDMQRTLIKLYQQSDDRTSALRQYHHYRNLLWEELGVEPDETTQLLYHQLEQTPIITQRVTYQLPPRTTSFIGRADIIHQVRRFIGENPLVTITAPGGAGKTRLALEIAYRIQDNYRHGVCFIDLSEIAHADHVLPTIAKGLGLPDDNDKLAQVSTYLRNHDLLLILDNFEHVTDATPIVAHWLEHVPEIHLLITSREPLKLYGECVFQLNMLSLQESCQLFYERLRHIHADFQRTEAVDGQVKTICQRLDGLPLAIELAVTRTRTMSISEIATGLNRCLSLLTSDLRNMPRRQRTLLSTIEWSYSLLTPEQASLFRHLAVFRGGWRREAVDYVSVYAHELDALIDKNLIRRTGFGTNRFMMLETIREYAHYQLEKNEELTQAYDNLAKWCNHFAQDSMKRLRTSEQIEMVKQLQEEDHNIRVVLDYLMTQPAQLAIYTQIISGLSWTWNFLQIATLPFHHTQNALKLADQLSPALLADLLVAGGHSAHTLGHYELAETWHQQALDIYEKLGDTININYTRFFMSGRTINEARAQSSLVELRQKAIEAQDDFLLCLVNLNLSMVCLHSGKIDQSKIILEQGLAICERNNYWLIIPVYYMDYASIQYTSGNFDKAFKLLEQAASLSQDNGNIYNEAYALMDLCEVCFAIGYLDDLNHYLRQAEPLIKDLQLPVLYVRQYFWDSVLASMQNNIPQFYRTYQQVLRYLHGSDTNMSHYIINAVLFLSQWMAKRGEAIETCALLISGIDSFTQKHHMVYTHYQKMWRDNALKTLDDIDKHIAEKGEQMSINEILQTSQVLLDRLIQ